MYPHKDLCQTTNKGAPDKIACAFDKAASVLEACGFRYYTIFKDRKPEFISL